MRHCKSQIAIRHIVEFCYLYGYVQIYEIFMATVSSFFLQMLISVLVYLSLPAKTQPEEDGVLFEIKENVFKFDGNSIWQGKANSLLSCSRTCASQSACKRVIFEGSKGTCLLLGEGQTHLANTLVKQDGTFYLKKVI